MKVKKTINLASLLFYIFLLLNSCCKQEKNYHLEKHYDKSKRYTTIYLYNGASKIDSTSVFDYYGKSQIKKYDQNRWLVYYHGLGGSGVSSGNSLFLNVIDGKINIPFFINSMNKSYENESGFTKDSLDLNLNRNVLTIVSTHQENDKVLSSKILSVHYDEKQNLFSNGTINLKAATHVSTFDYEDLKFVPSKISESGAYPVLKIGSTTYVFYDKKWFWIKGGNEIVSIF